MPPKGKLRNRPVPTNPRPSTLGNPRRQSGSLMPDKPIQPNLKRFPTMLLYGPTGIGKTTFANDVANGKTNFLVTQDSHGSAAFRKVLSKDWQTSIAVVDEFLKSDPEKNPVLCIDTIDALCQQLEAFLCEQKGAESIDNKQAFGFRGGWGLMRTKIELLIDKLNSSGRGIIFVSHMYTEEIADTVPYTRITHGLSGKTFSCIEKLVECVLLMTFRKVESKDSRMKSQTFMKTVSTDLKTFNKAFAEIDLHRRMLICHGTRHWNVKFRAGELMFPSYIQLDVPPKNTAKKFLDLFHEVQQKISKKGR